MDVQLTPAQIESNLQRPIDELLAELGRSVRPPTVGARETPMRVLVAAGSAWLNERRVAICDRPRTSAEFVDFVNGGTAFRDVEAVAMIVDIVSAVYGRGWAVWWAAITLFKSSALRFCDWAPPVTVREV